MTSETWLVHATSKDEREAYIQWKEIKAQNYDAGEYHGRKEALMLLHVTKTVKEMTQYIIERKPTLSLTRQEPEAIIGGDMTQLLPPTRPLTADEKEMARALAKILGAHTIDRSEI
jgi:hypothetical protein